MGFKPDKGFTPDTGFTPDKPGISERLFTPISKQLTGKSLSERTQFLQKKRQSLIEESIEQERPIGATEFVARTIPAGIADIATEFIDLSPFDIGLIAATGGAARGIGAIPIKGTTIGQVVKKVAVGPGFKKSVAELGRLEQKLKPFAGQTANRSIAEATKPPSIFTSEGKEINKTPRTDLVPSIKRSIPPDARAIIDSLATKQSEILAADRGIIPSKIQVEMSKGINARQVLDNWTPGATANAETMFAMRIDLVERLGKLGSKPSKDAVEALSRDFIRADAMASETGRTLGSLNRVQSMAADQLKFISEQIGKLDLEGKDAAEKIFKQFQTPGFWDKFMEFRTASLLTSPFTQMRNIVGNAIGRAYRLPEKTIAGGVNLIESKIRGIPQERFIREGIADTVGMFRGFVPAIRNATKALLDETFVSESRVNEAVKFNRAIDGLGGKIIRLPFRALNAMDEFFATLASSGSLESQALRQAMREGSKNIATRTAELVKKPTPEMIAISKNESLVDTFRQPLGGASKMVQKAIQKNKVAKFIVPFFRTPVNLFKWSWRRGPTGVFSANNWKAIVKGTPEQRAEATARIALGQLFSAGIFAQAMQGNITGRLSGNPQKRQALMRQGIQPYSIKLGDKYVSYRSYEPISSVLGLIANASEVVNEKETEIDAGEVGKIVGETVKMLKDQSFLRGISDLTNAIDDPERFGDRFIQNSATSLIPTGLGYLSRLYDPVLRDPDSVPEAIKSRIPGFSKDIPPRLDVWGRPITKEGTLSQRAFLPSGVMTSRPDLTEEELLSFEKFPKRISKKYKGLELTTKERNMVTIAEGGIQKQLLDQLTSQPGYKSMAIADQQKAIDFIFTESRKAVRVPFFNAKFKIEFDKLKTDEEKIRLLEKWSRRKLIKR